MGLSSEALSEPCESKGVGGTTTGWEFNPTSEVLLHLSSISELAELASESSFLLHIRHLSAGHFQ